MADPKPILWHWRVRLKPGGAARSVVLSKTWKQLRWRMSEADAVEWADKNGCEIEKIPYSGEQYSDLYGPRAMADR